MKHFVSPLSLHEASERLLSIHGERLPGIWPIGVRTADSSPIEQNFIVYGEEAFFPPLTVHLQSEADATRVHILTRSILFNRFTLSLAVFAIIVTLGTYILFGDLEPMLLMMFGMSFGVFLLGYMLMGMQFELVRLIRYILAGSVTELDQPFWKRPNFILTVPTDLQTAQAQLATIENFKINGYQPDIRFWHPHPTGQRYDIDLEIINGRGLRISIKMDGYLRILDNGYIQIVGRWKLFWLTKVMLLIDLGLVIYVILDILLEILTDHHILGAWILWAMLGIIILSGLTWAVQHSKNKLIALIKGQLAEIPDFMSINTIE